MRDSNHRWLRVTCLLTSLGAGAMAMTPAEAAACGGTFCDGGVPQPMPVDQTGENVIFVLGDTEAEVHIQISIDPNTNAQQFAWMVPLAAVPDFSVGSQPLFTQVMNASVPTYGLQTTFESCDDSNGDGGLSASQGGGGTDAASTSGADETGGGEPDVLKQETVGAFDVVVLQDKQLAPIKQWLIDNGYQWDDNAAPILQQYIDEGNVIAALKLTNGADVQDVHPITLRYTSNETCFPLRLTRIAAVEDMDIRVFVLSESRAAPTNYRHVLVNPLKIDWLQLATNYKEVITQAVDAFEADGRAFVTEYAGPSNVVPTFGIFDPAWDHTAFAGLDPTLAVTTLNDQGLSYCYDSFDCSWNHPLIYGLLLEFLPPPVGVQPIDFYPDLASYAAQIDAAKWNNGDDFAAALLERVIEPGQHATDLLATWPYLTRMYTTISPQEMTADPIFHQNPDLGDVTNLRTAQNYVLCNGDGVVTLPDDRVIYVPGGGPWPDIPGEEWYAEEVQTVALKGAPMTIVNNTAVINKKLDEWNLSHGWPRPAGDTESPPTTSDTESGGTDSTSGSTGSDSASGSAGQNDDSGCGCRSASAPQGALWLGLSALGLLGLRRRRS
mgnify:CR=1 FL=1